MIKPRIFHNEALRYKYRWIICRSNMHVMQVHYVVSAFVSISLDSKCSQSGLMFQQFSFGQVPWEMGGL